MPPSWHLSLPASHDNAAGGQILSWRRLLQAGYSSMRRRKLESDANIVAATTAACEPFFTATTIVLASILKLTPEIKNRCILWAVLEGFFASIPKSKPELKNRCTQEGLSREKLASISKSGLEIKNRCTKEGVNREKLASIPKSGPEIKNRCSPRAKTRVILAAIHKLTP